MQTACTLPKSLTLNFTLQRFSVLTNSIRDEAQKNTTPGCSLPRGLHHILNSSCLTRFIIFHSLNCNFSSRTPRGRQAGRLPFIQMLFVSVFLSVFFV
ncbi:hypothetical protein E2320_013052 [Naja naja]|nr:hypothetical protein E2320_013052 [Naja naja]